MAALSWKQIGRFQTSASRLSPATLDKSIAKWRRALDAAEAMAEALTQTHATIYKHDVSRCAECQAVVAYRQHVAPRARP